MRVGVLIVGEEVPHAHVHVVPINNVASCRSRTSTAHPSPEALDDAAERLRTRLRELGHPRGRRVAQRELLPSTRGERPDELRVHAGEHPRRRRVGPGRAPTHIWSPTYTITRYARSAGDERRSRSARRHRRTSAETGQRRDHERDPREPNEQADPFLAGRRDRQLRLRDCGPCSARADEVRDDQQDRERRHPAGHDPERSFTNTVARHAGLRAASSGRSPRSSRPPPPPPPPCPDLRAAVRRRPHMCGSGTHGRPAGQVAGMADGGGRRDGFPAGFFDRADPSSDTAFYAPARLVTHIDDGPSPPSAPSTTSSASTATSSTSWARGCRTSATAPAP